MRFARAWRYTRPPPRWWRGYHLTRRQWLKVEPPDTPAVLLGRRFDFAYLLFFWAARSLSERLGVVLPSRDAGPTGVNRHRVLRHGAAPGPLRFERSP